MTSAALSDPQSAGSQRRRGLNTRVDRARSGFIDLGLPRALGLEARF